MKMSFDPIQIRKGSISAPTSCFGAAHKWPMAETENDPYFSAEPKSKHKNTFYCQFLED